MHSRFSDWSMLLLRIVIGIIFIYHGHQKWVLWATPAGQIPSAMLLLMRFLSVVEPLGGIAVIAGVLTRWAAGGFVLVMIGAVVMKMMLFHTPFSSGTNTGWEFDVLLLASSLLLAIQGAGTLALGKKKLS